MKLVAQSADSAVENLGCKPHAASLFVAGEKVLNLVQPALFVRIDTRLLDFREIAERQFAVVCESGGRSAKAAELMRGQGFMSVADVPEGTKGWRESGRELVKTGPLPAGTPP